MCCWTERWLRSAVRDAELRYLGSGVAQAADGDLGRHRTVSKALADGQGMVAGQHYCTPSIVAGEVDLSARRVQDILKDLGGAGRGPRR